MTRQVVSFHYILRDEAGQVLDSSNRDEPITFLEGSGAIIDGLEMALKSFTPGQKRIVSVSPEKGYGVHDPAQVRTVDRKQLPVAELNIGDMFQTGPDRHSPIVRVVAIDGDKVKLDANHPLAGQRLIFEVEITEKRPATAEEIDHGHVHGPGGHHHHH